MVKKIRQALKNEKGLTLVELLAVVVILGIISAIAIPSIGGLINNSKKDAHIANAQQMVNSAKLALTADELPSGGKITLNTLINDGYIEDMKDPSGTGSNPKYNKTDSYVIINVDEGNGTSSSVNYTYKVQLKGFGSAGILYIEEEDISNISRKDVTLP